MSVLVRGMEIPRTCAVCEWSDYLHPNAYCRRDQTTVNIETAKTSRPDWCPLIAVPTPHGRLGDLDELKSKFRHGKGDNDTDSAWISAIRRAITQAETIIEAEGSERQ